MDQYHAPIQEELETNCFHGLIGHSPAMQRIYRAIYSLAQINTTVLLHGETGTGKEMAAETIHRLSPRALGPLVRVNCASLHETLLESELFGHVKGAFTGAIGNRLGRFEIAQGGTLLLDEIGEISLATQARLLRVLETKSFERVGCNQTRCVDVHIIAATNKDLASDVRKGHFRADLFYRLSIVTLTLPPLREHREDIPLLVEHFIKYFNQLHCRQIKGITPRAMDNLTHYSWPGNVRELRNTIEYAFIYIKDNIIDVTDLPYCLTSTWSVSSTGERRKGERRKGERREGERGAGERRGGERGAGDRRAGERGESATYPSFAPSSSNILAPTLSQDIKATVLRNALEQNCWHIGHTAEALGIHRTTLWRYMQRLGLPTRDYSGPQKLDHKLR